jgi:hypothetical protein
VRLTPILRHQARSTDLLDADVHGTRRQDNIRLLVGGHGRSRPHERQARDGDVTGSTAPVLSLTRPFSAPVVTVTVVRPRR